MNRSPLASIIETNLDRMASGTTDDYNSNTLFEGSEKIPLYDSNQRNRHIGSTIPEEIDENDLSTNPLIQNDQLYGSQVSLKQTIEEKGQPKFGLKKQETKIGNIGSSGSKIDKKRTSILSGSKLGKLSVFGGKSMMAGEAEDSEEELDEKYDFVKLATADSPEALLQSMSFNVDTSLLYDIEKTCVLSEANSYCPILLQVNDKDL